MSERSAKRLILSGSLKADLEQLLSGAGAVWEWRGDELEFSVSKQKSARLRAQIAKRLVTDYKWQRLHNTPTAETWYYWLYAD
jgi:hypothetical protein